MLEKTFVNGALWAEQMLRSEGIRIKHQMNKIYKGASAAAEEGPPSKQIPPGNEK